MNRLHLVLILISSLLVNCDPPPLLHYSQMVKLSATVNDTAETISLGDTLKFTLTLPDTIVTDTGTVLVKSVQQAYYNYSFYQIDTLSVDSVLVIPTSINSTSATNGYTNYGVLNMNVNSKPYSTTLNVVPSIKGLFYLQIPMNPGVIKFNNGLGINLAVNFNVNNKHWYLFESYNPGFINGIAAADHAGYGFYCFRVK